MTKIFISYSRIDTEFTERVVERLRRVYGLPNVWYDDELYGGVRWWQTILTEIAAHDVFIYLLSNESVTSPYCQAEFTEAKRLQKPIVTVQIRDKTRLSSDLGEIQYVDMKRGLDDDKLARLIRAINEQSQLPKKKRALWKSATPLPTISSDEDTQASARADIQTPTLQVKIPTGVPKVDRTVARATIIGALLTGLLGVLAILVSVILPPLLNPTNGQITRTATQTIVALQNTALPDAMQSVAQTQTYEAGQTLTAIPNATFTATLDFGATVDAVATGTRAALQTAEAFNITQAAIDRAGTLTALPTNTPTAIPNSLQTAYSQAAAYNYHDGNAKWTKITQDFEGVAMMLVPQGCYLMGSDTGSADELPVKRQCFSQSFWIDKTEVMQVQFKRLRGIKANANSFEGDNRPVENINWFEARDFCELRGARLPTEAEWEYVARGPDNWFYPWGNEWNSSKAVSNRSGSQGTADVGTLPAGASWVGAFDMSGNVWEWVSSLYKPYPYDATDGREVNTGSNTSVLRGLRGGSWHDVDFGGLRGASRFRYYPNYGIEYGGFRCARSS